MTSLRPTTAFAIAALTLAGCSVVTSLQQVRGNKVDPDQLNELVIGTSTRADAQSLLGSPTAKATFDDNSWLYITETTQPRVGRIQGVNDQGVVVLSFDQGGVLRQVKRLDQADSQPVGVVARATPSPGSESSFMQQLLGNVGKFTPGGPSAGSSLGGSGATLGGP